MSAHARRNVTRVDGLDDYPTTPDARYGQLAAGNTWTGDNKFIIPKATWYDNALYDDTNGEHFDTTFSGWTAEDAADSASTSDGFLTIAANSSNTSFAYHRQSGINIESLATSAFSDCYVGPIFLRQIAYTDDITVIIGLHKDSSGSPDLNNFVATEIYYDSANDKWKMRGTRKDPGGFQAYSSYIELSEFPLIQGFWIRNVIQKAGSVKCTLSNLKNYVAHYQIYGSVLASTVWGDYHVRVSMSRGAGAQFYIAIGGIDFSSQG